MDVGDICFLINDEELTEVKFTGYTPILDFQATYTIKKLKNNNTFFADGMMVGIETIKEKLG